MPKFMQRWTSEEELTLLKLSEDHKLGEIAEIIGRSYQSLYNKLHNLRAKMKDEESVKAAVTTPLNSRQILRSREVYLGCDFDCERCPYSDCLAPPTACERGLDINEYIRYPYGRKANKGRRKR